MASSSSLPPGDLDDYSSSDSLHTPDLPAAQNMGYISLPDVPASSQSNGVDLNLLLQGLVSYSQESTMPAMVCHLIHFEFLTCVNRKR